MAVSIHPTAIIEQGAGLGADVTIGPYCTVGPKVTLGDRVKLVSHVVLAGRTTIGADTIVYPFASLGHPPQDLKFKGEDTALEIGTNNQIREHATLNPGTEGGGGVTRLGHHNLLMIGAHLAHDCIVGDHNVLANNVSLAGHVVAGDHIIIGGMSGVHQYVRIGSHAIIGGMTGVDSDVIPYGLVKGKRGYLAGLNVVGLERRGFGKDDIKSLRNAYQIVFGADGTLMDRVNEAAEKYKNQTEVGQIVDFIRTSSSRRLCQPLAERGSGA